MISVTNKAIEKIKQISEEEGVGHLVIRLKVIGGGCAGFSYDLYFDEVTEENDEIIEQDNIKILIDPVSFQYIEDVEIDFVKEQYSSGFKFNNPNVKGTCGCGSSFSV
jgi:iron-sulfur cluster insertion protein